MLLLIPPSGCLNSNSHVRSTESISRARSEQVLAELERGASRVFPSASYFKPNTDTAPEAFLPLAPLIVHELANDGPQGLRAARFGDVADIRCGSTVASRQVRRARGAEIPTVYSARRTVRLNGQTLSQVCYVWWYRPSDSAMEEDAFQARGVVMTLGKDGFPIVWQPIVARGAGHPLFVSRSLEHRAALQHGKPHPGRKYAIEPGPEGFPDAIVVRLIDDPPVAMGPYVYLNATHAYSTLLCRCSSSQVDRFAEESVYELRPLTELCQDRQDRRNAKKLGVRCTAEGAAWISLPDDLAVLRALRWPTDKER